MKSFIQIFVCGMWIGLISCSSFAQGSDSATQPQSSGVSTKETRAQNRLVEREVRKMFTMTKGLNSSSIVVIARGGLITLSGSVPSASQIQLAGDVAQKAPDAKSVANHIVVGEPGR
jgi:hyperosmotically inducible periplasmic protein